MAEVRAHVDQPREAVASRLWQVAGEQGWTYVQAESSPDLLVFSKGASAFSWGSQLRVRLEPVAESATTLTFFTSETFALTDWGRGRRAVGKLVDALGARAE